MLRVGLTKTGALLTLTLLVTGCSTKLIGSPTDRSAVISRINLVSTNPDNRTTVAVKRSLAEHGIQVTYKAPLTLALDKMHFKHPFPDQIDAGVAFTTTATLSATYKLTTAKGNAIIPEREVNASQSLFHNANQVNTSSMDNIFMRILSKRLANSIYYQLSATNTIKKIKKTLKEKHAAKRH